jgi:hypothetical protein
VSISKAQLLGICGNAIPETVLKRRRKKSSFAKNSSEVKKGGEKRAFCEPPAIRQFFSADQANLERK